MTELNSGSNYFDSRLRNETFTAWEVVGIAAINLTSCSAILACAFGWLPTPAALERLAKGPLFNFKAVLIGAAFGASIGAIFGVWSGRDPLERGYVVHKTTKKQVTTLGVVAGLHALSALGFGALTICARRWCHSAVVAGTSGVMGSLYAFSFTVDSTGSATSLVWPSPGTDDEPL